MFKAIFKLGHFQSQKLTTTDKRKQPKVREEYRESTNSHHNQQWAVQHRTAVVHTAGSVSAILICQLSRITSDMQHQQTKSRTKSQSAYIKSIILDPYASGCRDISYVCYFTKRRYNWSHACSWKNVNGLPYNITRDLSTFPVSFVEISKVWIIECVCNSLGALQSDSVSSLAVRFLLPSDLIRSFFAGTFLSGRSRSLSFLSGHSRSLSFLPDWNCERKLSPPYIMSCVTRHNF